MSRNAFAIVRHDGSLALGLRIVRAPSGIYVVLAAGQNRPGHDPHTSWHRDGRFHHKTSNRKTMPLQRQSLDEFTGTEIFVQTYITGEMAGFPNCNPAEFDGIMGVKESILGTPPDSTIILIELVARDAQPAAPQTHTQRLLQRFSIADGDPIIVVSLYTQAAR